MKRFILFAAALLAGLTATAAAIQMDQQVLASKLVRLHVVANSDSQQDQELKLKVRDAVLDVAGGLNITELENSIPQIRTAARDCLRTLGSSYSVDVSLLPERFPTRYYDTFSLPSGVYTALRVTIGEGAGQNWWCVTFPSICFQASIDDLKTTAAAAGFSSEEIALITGDNEYVLKFKSIELLDALKQWIANK